MYESSRNIEDIEFPMTPRKLVEHLRRKEGQKQPIIVLPSIQRDVVWKPKQICELWDSLLCGIPIPSLILREVNEGNLGDARIVQDRYGDRRGESQARHGQVREGDYFLLDGHQRCMAILAGYGELENIRLWLDLGWTKRNPDRRWGFFLCTKARPWGDRDDFRKADPNMIRAARQSLYEELGMLKDGCFDFRIPLKNTWPVHATVPLPFGKLLTRVGGDLCNIDGNELKNQSIRVVSETESGLPPRKAETIVKAMMELSKGAWEMLHNAMTKLTSASIHAVTGDMNDDDLLLAFQRLNQNGTDLRPAELFFSGIKNLFPTCVSIDGALRGAKGSLFNDLDNLRGITVIASHGLTDRTALDHETLKQLREKGESFDVSFKAVERRSETLFKRLMTVLDMIQLPFVMRPRLASRTWIPILAWIDRFDDAQKFNEAINASANDIQRFVLADHFFGLWKEEDQLLREMIGKVRRFEQFPRIEQFENSEYNWLQQLDDPQILGPDPLRLPLAPQEIDVFIKRRLERDKWPLDVDGTLWKSGRWVDLLLWNQRSSVDEWFGEFKEEILILGDEGRPWDNDHIVPYSFFYGYSNILRDDLTHVLKPSDENTAKAEQLWDRLRSYRNHTGNYRVWPSNSNRSLQDCCAKDKLDPNLQSSTQNPWIVLSTWWNEKTTSQDHDWLNKASATSGEESWCDTATQASDRGRRQLEAFVDSVIARERRLYKALFDEIKDGFSANRFDDRIQSK